MPARWNDELACMWSCTIFELWRRPGRCVKTISEVVYINDLSGAKWCFEDRNC